jgi:hypothetical protein
MTRECQVRICERLGVKFPGPTRPDIKPGPGVAKQGGLHVILSEFHEAARIDRQLIGRCGRQGDPGTIEIIASLEDELMTVFAARLAAVLNRAASDDNRLLPRTMARLTRWYATPARNSCTIAYGGRRCGC